MSVKSAAQMCKYLRLTWGFSDHSIRFTGIVSMFNINTGFGVPDLLCVRRYATQKLDMRIGVLANPEKVCLI